jgi:Flp pilus assembly pilin Flp
MRRLFREFLNDETGQDLIEYTLILAFVALASAAIFTQAGGSVTTIWEGAKTKLDDAAGAIEGTPAP